MDKSYWPNSVEIWLIGYPSPIPGGNRIVLEDERSYEKYKAIRHIAKAKRLSEDQVVKLLEYSHKRWAEEAIRKEHQENSSLTQFMKDHMLKSAFRANQQWEAIFDEDDPKLKNAIDAYEKWLDDNTLPPIIRRFKFPWR